MCEIQTLDTNDYIIEKGTINHIDELENLYDDLNDYLELGTNYPRWAKGIYPIRETAVSGIENNNLFILKLHTLKQLGELKQNIKISL